MRQLEVFAGFIECRKQYSRHRPPALRSLSFDVEPGRVTALLGPNGSGKSTAFRAAVGLIGLDGGSVELFGATGKGSLTEVIGRVRVVPDTPTWFGRFDAATTLSLLADVAGLAPSRVDEVLEDVGPNDNAATAVGEFSLGMRQRLALAVAMLEKPDLLVLDEPANGLDPAGSAQLRTFLRRFADAGGTVLLSSHLLADVEQLADDVVVVVRGEVVEVARLADLVDRHRGVVVRLPAERAADAAEVLEGAGFRVDHTDRTTAELTVRGASAPEQVAEALGRAGLWVSYLAADRQSLEAHYLELVGDQETAPWGR